MSILDSPILLFDGTSVSNAGAAAAVLLMPNGRRYTVSQFLSKATEQEAEYQGLIIGLQKAQKLGIRQLEVKGDSELIFHQINGFAQIKEKNLLNLYQEVIKLMRSFEKVHLTLIPPEQNRSAVAAATRCIGEALGRETSSTSSMAVQITPTVARMIKLGSKATEEDYKNLLAEKDDFTDKDLPELRELVPDTIRDEIALHWDGEDEHLAEIYRWYLRGLLTDMAIRKVEIDKKASISEQEITKLPWEGELKPPVINKTTVQDLTQKNPFAPLSEDKVLDINEKETLIFPVPEEVEIPIDSLIIPQPESLPEQPIKREKHLAAEQTLIQSELYESKTLIETDPSKDTIPSHEKVNHILELINTLPFEEKVDLFKALVKSPALVNLMLKAIAEQMNPSKT